jgi:hypothetical protein
MAPLQITVDIVFEDHEIVAVGEFEHARGDFGAHARTCRVVRHGIQDEQLRRSRQQAERGDIRAIDSAIPRCARQSRKARTSRTTPDPRRTPGPRARETAAQRVNGLGRPGAGHDLFWRDHDASLAEPRVSASRSG